ncbi:helix-turn-helix domain-containing protein [Geofilum rubicundum]|uniref:Transcriptional regulator containing an amidase domain and an AraC-type DNA-binding HTH domain n=1 Tax=Geofilum rubicundum JCM 15548 TaxID=1236989 RepID=A0A0E9M013_9BACT|nr:AraC family transcriptional regulator [Geofilum rubicundum]GAO30726.1 transcriptional regulator containing an amidase domain and an AraC-type DNA-binding HTH domain [Geofilum rubicundum JCM 15548]
MEHVFYKKPDAGDPSDVLQLFPRYNLQILCCRYWWLKKWEFKELAFPYWRIYYNKIAGASIRHNGRVYELNPDSIVLIAPNTSFQSSLTGKLAPDKEYELEGGRIDDGMNEQEIIENGSIPHLFIHFNLGMPYDHIPPGVFVSELNQSIERRVKTIVDHLQKDFRRFSFYSSLDVQALIAELLADIPKSKWDLISKDHRILNVLSHIERNLNRDLNNQVLAQTTSMATNAFTRLFTAETGLSPQRYIKKKRIEEACILLHHSDFTIDQIAVKCGFADRFHFSRIFKQITNIPPAWYRKGFVQ